MKIKHAQRSQTSVGIHIMCRLFVLEFNQTLISSIDLKKKIYNNIQENAPSSSAVVPCGRTDMTKITAAFCNCFANTLKIKL